MSGFRLKYCAATSFQSSKNTDHRLGRRLTARGGRLRLFGTH